MDSSEHVEHFGTKKFQTWNMHTLATVKFNQITIWSSFDFWKWFWSETTCSSLVLMASIHEHHYPKLLKPFVNIQIQIWGFEYFHYWINSILLFNMIPSTKVNLKIIPIYHYHAYSWSSPNIMPTYFCGPSS
jgi:hypothetical protein